MPEVNFDKVRALRVEYSLSQEKAAELLDINVTTYHRKESGKSPFFLIEAKILAEYFNLTIEEVFFAPKVHKREQ